MSHRLLLCFIVLSLFSANSLAGLADGFFLDQRYGALNAGQNNATNSPTSDEETKRLRQQALEQQLAKNQAMIAAQLNAANQSAAEAMREARKAAVSRSPMHILMRIALAIILLMAGLLLVGDKLPQASALTDRLLPMASVIGFAAIGIAVFDLLLDVVTLRPLIGDGLPQFAGLAAGPLLARETIDEYIENGLITTFLNALSENRTLLGFAALILGAAHLLIGGFPLI